MKRMAVVLVGGVVMLLALAGTALASGCGSYTCSPSPTTIVKGNGGGGGTTAFTGGSVSTALIAVVALAVVGLLALFVARRRAAHSA